MCDRFEKVTGDVMEASFITGAHSNTSIGPRAALTRALKV